MSAATLMSDKSTSSRIKALQLPAADTRKALRVLALSDALISLFFTKPAATAMPMSGIKPAFHAQ